MTPDEKVQQELCGYVQRILRSPSEIENLLSVIDSLVEMYPHRLSAVNQLTEAAAQADSSAIASRLIEAANFTREGKAATAWMRHVNSHMERIKPPPPEKPLPSLNKVQVSQAEFGDVMRQRNAYEDPDAKGCERRRGGYICWLAPDGRIAGVEICEFDGRGEYFPPAFVVFEPWVKD